MATEEERIANLEEKATQEEAARMTLLDIVRGIDRKVDELAGMAKATQIESSIIETRLTTIDRRLDAVKLDMTNSFRQAEATMATKQDISRLEGMIGDILAGNAQQSEIMLQVLAKLSEKQGE